MSMVVRVVGAYEGLNIFDAAQNKHNRRADPTDGEHDFQDSDTKGNEQFHAPSMVAHGRKLR